MGCGGVGGVGVWEGRERATDMQVPTHTLPLFPTHSQTCNNVQDTTLQVYSIAPLQYFTK